MYKINLTAVLVYCVFVCQKCEMVKSDMDQLRHQIMKPDEDLYSVSNDKIKHGSLSKLDKDLISYQWQNLRLLTVPTQALSIYPYITVTQIYKY